MDETMTMKVGAVAEAAGLTVRTLHHWDRLGLLSPSECSPAGHREYTEVDLVRLYQVLARRNLGLSLESIDVCLDTGVDPARLVRDHLAQVEAAAAKVEDLDAGRVPDTPALLDAVRATAPSAGSARVPVAVASVAVLPLCTLAYAVVAALGDAPWGGAGLRSAGTAAGATRGTGRPRSTPPT